MTMRSRRRWLLAQQVRYGDFRRLASELGLVLEAVTAQAFPGRPEPARAVWSAPDGQTSLAFTYRVDPDRRWVELLAAEEGDAGFADSLSHVVEHRLELRTLDGVIDDLHSTDPSAAFAAAFILADAGDRRAVDELIRSLRSDRDGHSLSASLRAIEQAEAVRAIDAVEGLTRQRELPPEVRLLARDVLSTLRGLAL